MNTFKMCKFVQKYTLIAAAEVFNYTDWEKPYAAEHIRELPEKLMGTEGFEKINPSNLTAKEMKALNFGMWSEESEIRMIPLWLLPFLVDEFMGGTIDDLTIRPIKKADIDNDHRFGYLAYVLYPRNSNGFGNR